MAKTYEVRTVVSKKVSTSLISAGSEAEARKIGTRKGEVLSVVKAGGFSFTTAMSLADRMIFLSRMASMLTSKVGTSEALDIIYQSFTGPVREAARILKDKIASGSSLPDAMEFAGHKYFPDVVVAIVRTGARGGDMAYAIREAARFEKELASVQKKSSKGIWSALAGFVAGVVTILTSTLYVAPEIMKSSLVKQAGSDVDVGWVMTMASVCSWAAGLISLVFGGIFIYGVVLRPLAPAAIDRGIMRIPFYRDMAMAKSNYMVFFGFSVLLKAGLRVEEALKLSVESAPKGELRNDLQRALDTVVKGSSKPWANAMRMLHPTDKAALATAQDRAQTAKTIEDLALQYEMLYHSRLELFVPAVQMFSAVFLTLAGFILFGVAIIPLLQTMNSILEKV